MSIKTTKRLALGVIAALVFAPFAAIAPASAGANLGTVTVSNSSTTCFVGDVCKALITVTTAVAGPATADVDDVITLTTASATSVTGATAIAKVDDIAQNGAAPVSTKFLLRAAGAGASLATTASAVLVPSIAGTKLTLTPANSAAAGSYASGQLEFMANTPGTYTFTVTPATPGAGDTEVAGTITVKVLSLGAVSGDGGAAASPFSSVSGVAGVANFVTIKATGAARTAAALATQVVVSGGAMTSASAGTLSADKTSLIIAGINDATGPGTDSTIVVATPTVGTITVSTYLQSQPGIFGTTAIDTVTITVNATAVANVYSAAKSTVHVATNDNAPTATTDTAVATTPIVVASTLNTGTPVARVLVSQNDANGNALTSGFKTVTASISGAGLLGTANNAASGTSVTPTAAATNGIWVYANGTAGVGTITVSVDGAVSKTFTVTFRGALASLTATGKIASINADGGAVAAVFEVVAKDANGVVLPSIGVTFDKAGDATLVSTATAANTDSDGKTSVTVVPIAGKYGTTTVTVKSGTVISNAVTVVFAHNQIATATLALDAATYLPGVKAKLTMAAKDKNGLIVPDALTAASTLAFSSNLSTTTTFGTAPTFVAGAYAQDVFAPALTNLTDWTVSVKITANAIFATTLVPAAGATLTATAKVGIPPAPVVVPPVVYDNPTLSFVKDGGRIILSGTAVDGEGDIIIYTKKVGTTAWKERAKTLEVAAPGDFNGSIKAPKSNVLIRVKQEGTGQFSNQIIVLK